MDGHPPLSSPPVGHSSNSASPLQTLMPLLCILAFIGFTVLVYAFFFNLKCPPNLFERLGRRSGRLAGAPKGRSTSTDYMDQLVLIVKYEEEEEHRGDSGAGDCPVCLTAFVGGEIIRQVKDCKHLFHESCIDSWLASHSNCPVCRALIAVKRRPKPPARVADGEDDFRHGLPDSATLV